MNLSHKKNRFHLPMHQSQMRFNDTLQQNIVPEPTNVNMIVDNRERSPPFNWSEGVFQRWKPISGDFEIGTGECGNNPTGRAFHANPCGYWENSNEQFFSGDTFSKAKVHSWNAGPASIEGALYPKENKSSYVGRPQDRVVFGYVRIGEEIRSR